MPELVREAELLDDEGEAKLKRVNGLRYLGIATDTTVATIMIFALFIRSARALVGWGTIERRCLIAYCNFTLHGMGTFVYATDRDSQNYREEEHGKEFCKNQISHSLTIATIINRQQ